MTDVIFRPVVAGRVQLAPLSVDDYHRRIKSGELPEDPSVELLGGYLVHKDRSAAGEDPMTVGDKHALVIQKLVRVAPRFEKLGCHVRIQQPIALPPKDEPEPDASIAIGKPEDYASRKPRARDVACVIEVADSSLRLDRTIKYRAYAAAGIALYLIVNIPDHVIEVYSRPNRTTGKYREHRIVRSSELVRIALGKRRSIEIAARDLLP